MSHQDTKYDNFPSFPSWDIVFKRFSKFHPCWPQMTSTKTIGFLYSLWYTCTPNMRSVEASLLEISYLWGYHNLIAVNPKWLSTSKHGSKTIDLWPPPKTIGFLYSMWYAYIPNTRSVQASLLEISCLQGFYNLTPVDPKWPLTSTKNNRVLVLNVVCLHPKYNICPSFPSWDIVFTRFSRFDPCWPQMTFDLHQKQ